MLLNEKRNWVGIKSFFKEKCEELKALSDKRDSTLEKLTSDCSNKIIGALNRQLSKIAFFRNEIDAEIIHKMEKAPLTDSACESHMAQLDVRVDYCGGSALINTISDKQVIAVNKYFMSAEFSKQDAGELFKWARNADEAKNANQL